MPVSIKYSTFFLLKHISGLHQHLDHNDVVDGGHGHVKVHVLFTHRPQNGCGEHLIHVPMNANLILNKFHPHSETKKQLTFDTIVYTN